MDVLALPSEGSETFGRVLVEAQACGIPVLGAANGGIPEALANGDTGRVLPPGDVAAWSQAIGEMTADYRRARFTVNARAFAQRFDSHRIAADFVRILEAFDPRPGFDAAEPSSPTALEARITLAEGIAGD
jgi:glycosyltransferase involved in cell wall biosynthesis